MNNRRIQYPPPRWLKCPRIGSMLYDLFVPCKTPLDSKFADSVPPEDVFDPDCLFECVRPVQIGLLIDLTKSKRFYDRKEIEMHGCTYLKIACKGNEECPTEEQVNLFIEVVKRFENANPAGDKKICVHCTHGFNRTGFLIISYLFEECDLDLDYCVKVFAEARPPGIYKADYFHELYRRYDPGRICPPAPDLPDWCFDEQSSLAPVHLKRKHPDSPPTASDHNEGGQDNDGDDDNLVGVTTFKLVCSDSASLRLPPAPSGQPKLMAGVTGVQTMDQKSFEAHHVRTVVDYLIRVGAVDPNREDEQERESGEDAPPRDHDAEDQLQLGSSSQQPLSLPLNQEPTLRFRGSQPVSMTRQNAHLIADTPYAVSYKSDGTRYLMLIHGPDKVYLIDRGNFVYKTDKLQFPTREWLREELDARRRNQGEASTATDFMTKPGGHLVNSLIDGELISFDNSPDRPFKFLVYDILTIQGYPLGRCPFDVRYNAIEKYVVRPRNDAGHNQLVDFTTQSFSVRRKPFFRLENVRGLLRDTRATLQHETDGLIFQPTGPTDFYVIGTCKETLKWKPPELNTIDFRCKVYLRKALGEVDTYVGELYLGGSRVPNAHLARVTSKDLSLDGKIVECTCDPRLRGWKVMRVRTDKSEPNHLSVGKLIMESILYPVTASDVLTMVNLLLQNQQQQQRKTKTHPEGHSSASAAAAAPSASSSAASSSSALYSHNPHQY